MLRICLRLLGLVRGKESKGREYLRGHSFSADLSLRPRDFVVRIVHAGGREEVYQKSVPASQLMEQYPGMCVARPEVFKNPHESLLRPEEELLPGQKYYLIPSTTAEKLKQKHLIPSTTAEKLKQKHLAKAKINEPTEGKEKNSCGVLEDLEGDDSDDSFCSAKDFYVSQEKFSRCIMRRCAAKKPFVPPIPKAKSWREDGWEPSLTSVQELSP